MIDMLNKSGLRHIEVQYETLRLDPTAFSTILDFLEVRPVGVLTSSLRKLNPEDYEKVIGNYENVRRALIGTRFERFLAK